MSSELKQKIQDEMKAAMRAKETLKLGTIRMLMAAIKQREIDEKITLDDGNILSVINKMIKQRRESHKQFIEANRPELAEKEQQEIEVLEAYLPPQLTDAEIDSAVAAAISAAGASSMKDMGKVMGSLKAELEGKADMSAVSAIVKAKLAA